ncbi:TetR/AcrR family transcriptional regulator [Streptomyces sp. P38-E01]|uniref:TetR/AcrR family transcriptional regulator n=1 Tax=Streptomyces tardus TaxID=2780544 RepID=A0A949N4U8_9ACTN|nr:TetR/AcrR family transcriptional regulator [Streptomyces tardus]MBU7598294.1 TetR/AcrR family transcriptional regulator [Streptomyces tardus]
MARSVSSTSQTPGTTSRTRRAILDAAVTVMSQDRNAPFSEIAKAAEVGRSTLHRYYPDRSALVGALVRDASRATEIAFVEAELDSGTPEEALHRLVPAMFDLGPRVGFLFNELEHSELDWDERAWEASHIPVGMLFHRGRQEGYFDPEIDDDWFVRILWYSMMAGLEAVGERKLSKHQAIARVVRLLEGGLLNRNG